MRHRRRGSLYTRGSVAKTQYGDTPIRTKLTFVEHGTITLSSAQSAFVQYRLNAPFDPAVTTSAVQPLGYDQYSALYRRYQVTGCKVSVTFQKFTTAIDIGFVHLISKEDSVSYNASATTSLLAWPNVVTRKIDGPIANQKSVTRISRYYRILSVLSKPQTASLTTALTTTIPTSIAFLNVGASSNDGTVEAAEIKYMLKMVFYTKFYEPVDKLGFS